MSHSAAAPTLSPNALSAFSFSEFQLEIEKKTNLSEVHAGPKKTIDNGQISGGGDVSGVGKWVMVALAR